MATFTTKYYILLLISVTFVCYASAFQEQNAQSLKNVDGKKDHFNKKDWNHLMKEIKKSAEGENKKAWNYLQHVLESMNGRKGKKIREHWFALFTRIQSSGGITEEQWSDIKDTAYKIKNFETNDRLDVWRRISELLQKPGGQIGKTWKQIRKLLDSLKHYDSNVYRKLLKDLMTKLNNEDVTEMPTPEYTTEGNTETPTDGYTEYPTEDYTTEGYTEYPTEGYTEYPTEGYTEYPTDDYTPEVPTEFPEHPSLKDVQKKLKLLNDYKTGLLEQKRTPELERRVKMELGALYSLLDQLINKDEPRSLYYALYFMSKYLIELFGSLTIHDWWERILWITLYMSDMIAPYVNY